MASTSCGVNGRGVPLPAWRPEALGTTISVFAPSDAICVCTDAVTPLPTVTIVTTAATPMTMPEHRQDRTKQVTPYLAKARRSEAPSMPAKVKKCGRCYERQRSGVRRST